MFPFLCPKCGLTLTEQNKSLTCPAGHCYDRAKSGYVNLVLVNKKHSADPGDNKEMIAARVRVMNDGYYDSLADRIVNIIGNYPRDVLVDVGCGVGSITGKLKEKYPESIVLGTDISKNAADAAAKKYKNVSFCVASSSDLPLPSEYADVVICAFAPVFAEEFARVLRPGGVFIRVVPDVMHLYGLKSVLYKEPRKNEPDVDEPMGFEKISTFKVADDFTAKGETVASLIKMTPYYYHTPKADLERVFAMPELTTNRAFEVRVYQKNAL